jgi:hypothetical protein|tara:strand:- start:837 stop:1229 length:393 start_codon:yes stop_codon:yes gene_type:complete
MKITGVPYENITKLIGKTKAQVEKIAGKQKPAAGGSHIFSNGTYTLSGDEWQGTQVFTNSSTTEGNSISCGTIRALGIRSILVRAGSRSGFDIIIDGMTRANSTFSGTGNGSTLTFALRGIDSFTITYTT